MNETIITLRLKLSEVNDVLRTLGDLPTKSNAYPLMMIIKGQAEAQVNTSPPVEVDKPTE